MLYLSERYNIERDEWRVLDEPLVPVVFKVHESSRVEHHGYLIVDVELYLEGFKVHGGFGLGRRDLQSTTAALNLAAGMDWGRASQGNERVFTCMYTLREFFKMFLSQMKHTHLHLLQPDTMSAICLYTYLWEFRQDLQLSNAN